MKPISKILIAYDGSKCSNAALSDLRRAGLPASLEVVVASVAFVFLPEDVEVPENEIVSPEASRLIRPTQEHAEHAVHEALVVATQGAERLKTDFPGWSVQAQADGDSPAWSIIRMAGTHEVDLIVLGSNSHVSMGGRLIMGSVAQRVIYEAPCSVRLGRYSGAQREGPVRIVVGFNGTPDAQAALDAVAARVWPEGSEARVIIARSALNPDEALEKVRAAGLSASEIMTDDEPAHFLVKEAEEWAADSIFVGTRDIHGFPHLLHGSVSSAVAASARCSVEVVRQNRTAV